MLFVAFAAVRLGVLEILRIFSRTPNLHISKKRKQSYFIHTYVVVKSIGEKFSVAAPSAFRQ